MRGVMMCVSLLKSTVFFLVFCYCVCRVLLSSCEDRPLKLIEFCDALVFGGHPCQCNLAIAMEFLHFCHPWHFSSLPTQRRR